MATCFCGHGEKVGITSRGINKQGQRTVELLSQLQAVREAVGDLDSLGSLDEFIGEGEEYGAEWSALVHGANVPPSEARAFKKEWNAWGRRGMMLSAAIQKHAKPTSGRKGFTQLFALKEDVEGRLASLAPASETHKAGSDLLARLEPTLRAEFPEDAEPGFIQQQMIEADLWLAATSDGWRYRAT